MINLLKREWLLAVRRLNEILLPVFFLLIITAIFPIAIGGDENLLKKVSPGITWIAVLLSILLSAEKLYQSDFEDGSLEQLYLSGQCYFLAVGAKFMVQWGVHVLPILLSLPLLGLWYGLAFETTLQIALSLFIGSPSLMLLAMLGSAMTLVIERGGLLLILIIFPFYLPTLVFALSSINAFTEGFNNLGQLTMLMAILVLMITIIPFAIVATLKASLSEN